MIITVNQVIQMVGLLCQHFRWFLLFSAAVLALISSVSIIKKVMRI